MELLLASTDSLWSQLLCVTEFSVSKDDLKGELTEGMGETQQYQNL